MNTYDFLRVDELDKAYIKSINKLLGQLSSSGAVLTEDRLRDIIDSDSSELYLMRCNGVIAGMFTLCTYTSPTGRKCWLEDVVIDSEYRGLSLGKVLMNKVVELVKTKGDITLMLTSRPSRVAANKLYQSSGLDIKETNVYVKSFR